MEVESIIFWHIWLHCSHTGYNIYSIHLQVNSVFVFMDIYPVDLSLIYTSNTIEDSLHKDFVIHPETMEEGTQYKKKPK